MKPKYLLLVLLAVVIPRIVLLWTPVIDVDEAIYSLFANVWFHGGAPYIDCVETKPLGIYFIFGTLFKLFGDFNMLPVHLFLMLTVFLTGVVLYHIAKRFTTERGAFVAAIFYVIFSTTYTPKVIAAVIEPFMMLPVALFVHLWLRFEDERRGWLAFLSGVALSFSFVLKYTAGIYLFLFLSFVLLWGIRGRIKGISAFCLGLIPVPLVMVIYLYLRGSFPAFYFWTVQGSVDYISGGVASIDLVNQLLKRVLPYLIAILVPLIFMFKRLPAIFRRSCDKQEYFIWLWFLFSLAPVVVGKRFYGHYFIQFLPPLAIISAISLEKWWSEDTGRFLKGLIISFCLVAVIGTIVPRFMMEKIYSKVGEDNPKDYRPIAEYLKANTKADENIAVWGFAPLIYVYSNRTPSSRFFWSDLNAGRVPAAKQENGLAMQELPQTKLAWEMFFEDMKKRPPTYFIDTSPAKLHDYGKFPVSDYPQLRKYLAYNFKEEVRINGAVVYRKIQ